MSSTPSDSFSSRVVPVWVGADGQTDYLHQSHREASCQVTFDVSFDTVSKTASLRLKAPVVLKGEIIPTPLYIYIHADQIASLVYDSSDETPDDIREELGVAAPCLRFCLSKPADMVVPQAPLVPKRKGDRDALDSMKRLGQQTSFGMYFVQKPPLREATFRTLCDAVADRSLKAMGVDQDILRVYAGQPGRVLEAADLLPILPSLPPSYDKLPPPMPPHSEQGTGQAISKKRQRRDSTSDGDADPAILSNKLQQIAPGSGQIDHSGTQQQGSTSSASKQSLPPYPTQVPLPTISSTSVDKEHVRVLRHLVAEMCGGLKQEVHALKEELDATKQILEVTRQETAEAKQEAAEAKQEAAEVKQEAKQEAAEAKQEVAATRQETTEAKQEAAEAKQEAHRSTVELAAAMNQLGDNVERQESILRDQKVIVQIQKEISGVLTAIFDMLNTVRNDSERSLAEVKRELEEDLENRMGDVYQQVDQQMEDQIDEQLSAAKLELQEFIKDELHNTGLDIIRRLRDSTVHIEIESP